MLALPSLKGVPRFKRTATGDPLCARLALAAAGDRPIAPPRRRVQSIEVDVLHAQVNAWLQEQVGRMSLFFPSISIAVGRADERPDYDDDGAVLWLGVRQETLVGPVWHLEPKWKSLEKRRQGLAAWALSTIDSAGRWSFPLYTPVVCEYFAGWCWWHGEDDEGQILEDYRAEVGDPKAAAPDDMITRAKFDAALPHFVQRPHPGLAVKALERMASVRGTDLNRIAQLVLELRREIKAAARAKEPDMETSDDDGVHACHYASMLRWNGKDPMPQAYDDFVNEHANAVGVEEAFGHYVIETPADLPKVLRAIERRFRIARLVEELLPLIAERQR